MFKFFGCCVPNNNDQNPFENTTQVGVEQQTNQNSNQEADEGSIPPIENSNDQTTFRYTNTSKTKKTNNLQQQEIKKIEEKIDEIINEEDKEDDPAYDLFRGSAEINKPYKELSQDIEIFEEIGQGAFGKVYKAYDKKLNQFYALKHMRVIIEDEKYLNQNYEFNQILTEKKILERINTLNHDSFIQFISMNNIPSLTEEKTFVLVMEFGVTTLKRMIIYRNQKHMSQPYSDEEIAYIINDLINSLYIAEENNIVNRDIKTDNIILVEVSKGNYKYKISDFGIGYLMPPGIKELKGNEITGYTPFYCAPEVKLLFDSYSNDTYNPYKADCYSMGIIILEMMGITRNTIGKLKSELNEKISANQKKEINAKKNSQIFQLALKMIEPDCKKRISLEQSLQICQKLKKTKPQESQFVKIIPSKPIFINNRDTDDELKFYETYFEINLKWRNLEKCEEYCAKSLRILKKMLAENKNNIYLLQKKVNWLNNLSNIYIEKNDIDLALELSQESLDINLKILKKYDDSTSFAHNNLAQIFKKKKKFNLALDHAKLDLEIMLQSHGEDENTATSYNNLGLIYESMGDNNINPIENYTESLNYYNKAIKIWDFKYVPTADAATTYHNIANINKKLNNYYDGLINIKKSIKIRKKLFGRMNIFVAFSHEIIADLYYLNDKNYKKYIKHMEESLKIRIFLNNKGLYKTSNEELIEIYLNNAEIYKNAFQNLEKVKEIYNKILKITTNYKIDDNIMIKVFNDIAELNIKENNFEDAAKYLLKCEIIIKNMYEKINFSEKFKMIFSKDKNNIQEREKEKEIIYRKLINIFISLDNYKKSLKFKNKLLKLAQNQNNDDKSFNINMEIYEDLIRLRQFKQALEILENTKKLKKNDSLSIAEINIKISNCYFELNNYNDSLLYIMKSLKIFCENQPEDKEKIIELENRKKYIIEFISNN